MAKAQKLPSGAWRTQVSKKVNNKTIRKSFTVHPKDCGNDSKMAKKLSELYAREWSLKIEEDELFITVKKAIEDYIKVPSYGHVMVMDTQAMEDEHDYACDCFKCLYS